MHLKLYFHLLHYAAGNVYFIDLDEKGTNQAKRLSDLHDGHYDTARAVGANLGLFAVGKKLVFVEGKEASVDRLTYHKVAQGCFADAHLLPMGSVKNLNALRDVASELRDAIFGVELFMVRDRGGLTEDQVASLEANPRFRVLPRRHIENYFLDEEILTRVAKHFYLDDVKCSEERIRDALLQAAQSCLHSAALSAVKEVVHVSGALDVPKVKNPEELDADRLVKQIARQVETSVNAVVGRFSKPMIEKLVEKTLAELTACLTQTSL